MVVDTTGQPGDLLARIDAFWAWWRSVSGRVAEAVDEGRAGDWAQEIGRHVDDIERGLAWDLGPGRTSRHMLCLSPEGDASRRVLTQRWISRAPPADASWEYHPARQAAMKSRISLRADGTDAQLDLDSFRVLYRMDAARQRLHVAAHHPLMRMLSRRQRGLAAIRLLDNILGEDEVERWIGAIETSAEPLPDGRSVEELVDAVAELRRSARGERFAVVESRSADGQPTVAMVNLALKQIDHLLMDTHFEVHVALRHPTREGLHQPESAEELTELQGELLDDLGRDAIYIGRETGGGELVIHLHGAAAGPSEPRIRDWISRHPERLVDLVVRSDPHWEILSRW